MPAARKPAVLRVPAAAYATALGQGSADKRVDILRQVARTGSISQAAREAGVSYKAAWQAIDTLTNLAGVVLVERAVGGAGGGGARVTAAGLQLLAAADALGQARGAVLARLQAAGRHAPEPAAPSLGQLSIRTSMRNQLPCTVQALEVNGPMVLVRLQLGAGAAMVARITRESAELLALRPQEPVVVMCKATAVAVRRQGAASLTGEGMPNLLAGTAHRVARGAEGDEVAARLAAGPSLVGFAPPGTGLRAGSRVLMAVDAAALVIAIPG